jgi:gliding motility-associated-like protein
MKKIYLSLLLLICGAFAKAQINQTYLFSGNLNNTSGINPLTPVDYTGQSSGNTFQNDNISNCGISKSIYHVVQNAGVQFNGGAGSNYNVGYSVTLYFRAPGYTGGGWYRLLDVTNGVGDGGIYMLGNNLNFFPNGNVGVNLLATAVTNYVLLTLTRNTVTKVVTVYLNGVLATTYNDSADQYAINSLGNFIFIRDNNSGSAPNENGPANLAYINVTNSILTASEVASNYNNICNNPPVLTSNTASICPSSQLNLNTYFVKPTGPYKVEWHSDSTKNAATKITTALVSTSGNYYAWQKDTVNNTYSVSSTKFTVIVYPTIGVTLSATGLTRVCSSTGGVPLSATSSTASSYAWNSGQTAANITATSTNNYKITVTDVNGCTASDALAVTVNNSPTVTLSATGLTTVCSSTGGVPLRATSSTATSYAWSSGQTAANITATSTNNYKITVTDVNGCTASDALAVTVNNSPTVTVSATGPTTVCSSTGGVPLSATSSTASSYAWNSGQTAANITATSTNNYKITVTDVNGCTASDALAVTVNNSPTVTISATGPTTVCSSTGGVPLHATSSTASSYAWSSGETTVNIAATSTNNYKTTVTDVNGCTASDALAVTVNINPTVTIGITGPTTKCTSEGGVPLTANASTAINYIWVTGETTQSLTSLVSGIYNVMVTDANGCTGTSLVPANLTVHPNPTVNVSSLGASTICASAGPIKLLATTPTGISFQWDNGSATANRQVTASGRYGILVTDIYGCTGSNSTSVTVNANPTLTLASVGPAVVCSSVGQVVFQANAPTATSFLWNTGSLRTATTAILSGTYSITVTDANSCTTSASITATINPNPTVTIQAWGPTTVCNKPILVLAESSSATSYLWNTGHTTANASTNASGNIQVVVTDANGCTANNNIDLTINPNPTVTINPTGSTTVCASTGGVPLNAIATPGVTYRWNTGGLTNSITATSTGLHSVVATLATGCTATAQLNVVINQNPTITIAVTGTSTACASTGIPLRAITTNATLFSWNTNETVAAITASTTGTYEVTVSNTLGCTAMASQNIVINTNPTVTIIPSGPTTICASAGGVPLGLNAPNAVQYLWSNGQTGASYLATSSSGYTVVVTDRNGCTGTDRINITINQNPTVTLNASPNSGIVCANNFVTITALGALQYLWNTGQTTNQIRVNTPRTYQVLGTDANGCTAISRERSVQTIPIPVFNVVTTNASACIATDGKIQLNGLTSSGDYKLSYRYQTNPANLTVTASSSGSVELINLPIGAYFDFIVTDALTGCNSDILAGPFSINSTSSIRITESAAPKVCDYNKVTLTATGASNYSWSTGEQGTTVVTQVTDLISVTGSVNGCTATESFKPHQASIANVSITNVVLKNQRCFDTNEGAISVTVTGGVPTYKYYWSPLKPNASALSNLADGQYQLTVSDKNGCGLTASYTLTRPEKLQTTVSNTNLNCHGEDNASISVDKTMGGTSPYRYSLDNLTWQQTNIFPNLSAGRYAVWVKDNNNCTVSSRSISVNEPPLTQIALSAKPQVIEVGDTTVINAEIQSLPAGAVVSWTNAESLSCNNCWKNVMAKPEKTTLYTLQMVDAKGCKSSDTITIQVTKNKYVYIPTAFTPNGDGINDVFRPYSVRGIKSIRSFKVFDRWGELLYDNGAIGAADLETAGWNGYFKGELMRPNSYIYILEIEFVDDHIQLFKGDFNLMR